MRENYLRLGKYLPSENRQKKKNSKAPGVLEQFVFPLVRIKKKNSFVINQKKRLESLEWYYLTNEARLVLDH